MEFSLRLRSFYTRENLLSPSNAVQFSVQCPVRTPISILSLGPAPRDGFAESVRVAQHPCQRNTVMFRQIFPLLVAIQ